MSAISLQRDAQLQVPRVHLVPRQRWGIEEPLGTRVRLGFKPRREPPETREPQEPGEPREPRDRLDRRVRPGFEDPEAPGREILVRPERTLIPAQQGAQEIHRRGLWAWRDLRVSTRHSEPRVREVPREPLDSQAPLESKESQAGWVLRDLQAQSLGHPDPRGIQVSPGSRDPRDPPETTRTRCQDPREQPAHGEILVFLGNREIWDLQVRRVRKVLRPESGSLEFPVPRVLGKPASPEQRQRQQERQEQPDSRGGLDARGIPE